MFTFKYSKSYKLNTFKNIQTHEVKRCKIDYTAVVYKYKLS